MSDAQPLLRLLAQDKEDLSILSAAVQDAVLKVGDLSFLPRKKRFALVLNRFRWEDEARKDTQHRAGGPDRRRRPAKRHARIRSGLHFDGVLSVQSQNIVQQRKDGVLELLAITYEEPAAVADNGFITLVFSGGGSIRLTVECIEASLSDLSQPWPTDNLPDHGEDR